MELSTILLLVGAGLFVIPIPGTFVAGALTMLGGGVVRWLGG